MTREKSTLPEEQQTRLLELLNRSLADAIDLQLQSRQAYWNIKGPHFRTLRELFNEISQGVEEYTSLIAEHIVQLGSQAEGTVHAVARRSSLDKYPLTTTEGKNTHISALTTTLAAFGKQVRYASEQATELNDADTAAIFTEIARGIDKWLWLVETSQQAES